MATANVSNIIRVPGRICANPTDLTTAFPHGGTALGIVRDMEFRPVITSQTITAEEFGQAPVEGIYTGETPVFACVLREWDVDAINRIFVNTTANSSTGDRTLNGRVSATNRSGYLLSSKSFKLCFSPKALETHNFIVIYKAIPMPEETMAMQLSLAEEFGLAVAFRGIPDSTGRLYDVGKRADITL